MDLPADYLEEQNHVIQLCSNYAKGGGSPERYGATASFCSHYNTILSVGSAAWEPLKIRATHALDVSAVAERLLRLNGWTGTFVLGDCRKMPFTDKSFECGCCSEVVEHLPKCHDILLAVKELDRVCKNWILTTPLDGMNVPSHKRHITDEDAEFICRRTGAKFRKFSRWYFIWKGEHGPTF
jgi:hypothetical protein